MFILNAGKDLPKVCLVDPRSKAKNCKVRKTVGVRVPNHPVTQALLARLDRPLLCGTVPNLDETYDDDNQDPVLMLDEYERKGPRFPGGRRRDAQPGEHGDRPIERVAEADQAGRGGREHVGGRRRGSDSRV